MHKAEEDLLVIAAQQGNEKAFTFLCKYYQTSLSRFAFKLCGDRHQAQDAVQDAWIRIAKKLKTLDDPRAFKSWIFKAVRWCTYDLMRKSLRNEADCQQDISLENITAPEGDEIGKSEHFTTLLSLIEQLPEIDKQAVYLFYLEEMKISEIAQVLQIPSGTVKSRLNRARKILHERFNRNKGEIS
ncbi:RNA polymerase sigma factor [Pseudoalteromonas denitrificans]|uniref:RNA polymerase sigma-70 factor, ECF subfamily n=1 Tax=Pseudoalteromonas denitrificans DSM 6059 TaxID=1123010 RepID=A0A1I1DY90_9GAMM|nr:RNA polymerase sigma factor [Pseudoalteromonas denitrificans]SFB79871.1 RNA polymerase sigma-70 factor, ECF subfamily [Pseudoalteromonas denitrificans DSM 6059]